MPLPTPETLGRLAESDGRERPMGFGASIDEARAMFESGRFRGHETGEAKRRTLYTLRRLPFKGEARRGAPP